MFLSIDELPAFNYFKISDTSEYGYLFKKFKKVEPSERIASVWYSIQDQLHEEFGVNESFKDYVKLLKSLIDKRADVIETKGAPQRKAEMFLKMAEADMKAFIEGGEGGSLSESKVLVDKYMGYRIDLKKTSIQEFMSYIEAVRNG